MPELDENTHSDSLKVNKGVEQPPIINEAAVKRFLNRKKQLLKADEYVNGILSQNIAMLGQAITLVESTLDEHKQLAGQIVKQCLAYSGKAFKIGITGVPGVGKSTFIETLGTYLTNQGNKVAILAIDPSSAKSGGSILGDKTRMEKLSANPMAYIRPSPSAGTLGGVANKTRETAILCEAAGFNIILIETVGVGQSETIVHSMVDFFLLLMLAGAGDELQGIKRGIMEMADGLAITKADGSNIEKANRAMAEYKLALHLFPRTESGWVPQVQVCSAITQLGIENLWKTIEKYFQHTLHNGYLQHRRQKQSIEWFRKNAEESILQHFYNYSHTHYNLVEIEKQILEGKISPAHAASQLVENYTTHFNKT